MGGSSGRVYAAVSTDSGLRCYTGATDGSWSGIQVVSSGGWASSPVIRVNPVSGGMLIAYVDNPLTGRSRIYTLTKP